MKVCLIDGCDRKSRSLGMCEPHYLAEHRAKKRAARGDCIYPGCTYAARERGLCGRHMTCSDNPCAFDGCGRRIANAGLCRTHYQQRLDGIPLRPIKTRPVGNTHCSADGCELPVRCRGLCNRHYQQWQKHGRTIPDAPARPSVCSVGDCMRKASAKGLCKMHYNRWRRTGSTEPLHITRKPKPAPKPAPRPAPKPAPVLPPYVPGTLEHASPIENRKVLDADSVLVNPLPETPQLAELRQILTERLTTGDLASQATPDLLDMLGLTPEAVAA